MLEVYAAVEHPRDDRRGPRATASRRRELPPAEELLPQAGPAVTDPFDIAFAFTAAEEGEANHDRDDPGGLTWRGITQATYDRCRRALQEPVRDVLMMDDAEYRLIAMNYFWLPTRCEELEAPLWLPVFDSAFLLGVPHAVELLQVVLGAEPDGVIGPNTMRMLALADPMTLARDMVSARRGYHLKAAIDRPQSEKFLHGWTERCNRLDSLIAVTNVVG
jgi:lysozyme family protein